MVENCKFVAVCSKSVSVYIHKEIQTEPHIAENFRNSSTNSLTAK